MWSISNRGKELGSSICGVIPGPEKGLVFHNIWLLGHPTEGGQALLPVKARAYFCFHSKLAWTSWFCHGLGVMCFMCLLWSWLSLFNPAVLESYGDKEVGWACWTAIFGVLSNQSECLAGDYVACWFIAGSSSFHVPVHMFKPMYRDMGWMHIAMYWYGFVIASTIFKSTFII